MIKKIINFFLPKEIDVNQCEMELLTVTGNNVPIKEKVNSFIKEIENEILFEAKSNNKFITVSIPAGIDVYHQEIRDHFSKKKFIIEELKTRRDNIFLIFWVL